MRKRLTAQARVGLFFGFFTGACAVMMVVGVIVKRSDLALAGFMGTGWFFLLFSMPREWFLRDES